MLHNNQIPADPKNLKEPLLPAPLPTPPKDIAIPMQTISSIDPLKTTRERYEYEDEYGEDDRKKNNYSSCRMLAFALLCAGPTGGAIYGTNKLFKEREIKKDYLANQYTTNPNLLNPYYPNTTCAEVFDPYNVSTAYDFCNNYDNLKQNFNQTFNMTVPYDVFTTCYQTLDNCLVGGGGLLMFVTCIAAGTGFSTVVPCILSIGRSPACRDSRDYEQDSTTVQIKILKDNSPANVSKIIKIIKEMGIFGRNKENEIIPTLIHGYLTGKEDSSAPQPRK